MPIEVPSDPVVKQGRGGESKIDPWHIDPRQVHSEGERMTRVWKKTIVKGEACPVAGIIKGPEGTWLVGNSSTGSQGITDITRRLFNKTDDAASSTPFAVTSLTVANVVPYTGDADGPGILGDGWSSDPEGYNFLDIIPAATLDAAGASVVLAEYEIARSGATNSNAWGKLIIPVEITVLAAYGS